MITPLKDLNSMSDENMGLYMSEYRRKYSHLESSNISRGRTRFKKEEFQIKGFASNELIYKSRVYLHPGFNFIIRRIPDLLNETQRKAMNKPDLNFQKLDVLLARFLELGCERTMDVYFDGKFMSPSNIDVIWDENTFIFMTDEEPLDVNIVLREYVLDKFSNTNEIVLDNREKTIYNTSFKMVYADGVKTSNYTETVQDNSVTITVNQKVGCINLVLMPSYVRMVPVPAGIGWLDIYPDSKMTIDPEGLLIFMNGLLIKSSFDRKSNSLFKFNDFSNYSKDLVIFHYESDNEVVTTKDNLQWYRDNINSDVAKALNDDTAPTFVKYFKNPDNKTGIENADISGKTSLDYYPSVISDIMASDSLQIGHYIDTYMENRDNFITNYIVSMNDYGYTNYVRMDNSDVPKYANKPEKFFFPMVMFSFDNPYNRPFKVYVDGVALFRHIETYYSMGRTYVYFRKNKVLMNTYVEVELYNCANVAFSQDMMVDDTCKFTIPSLNKYDIENLISVTHIENDVMTSKDILYDRDTGYVTIKDGVAGLYNVRVDNAVVYGEHVINCREIEKISFDSPNHTHTKKDARYYKLYKNGKFIPSNKYTITFKENAAPSIDVQCKAFMSEQFCLEYNPYMVRTMYSLDTIDSYGKIKIEPSSVGNYPISQTIQSIYLNGRKLNMTNMKQNSSYSMELVNVLSTKNFSIVFDEDYEHYTNLPKFMQLVDGAYDGFDAYIKDIMVGSLINDIEQNVLEKDYDIMRDLYWDLYNEYLKNNIVDFGDSGVPDYIAIKYADLVNHEDMIYIDCSEQMNHWMPLDASMNAQENKDRLSKLYESVLLSIQETGEINPTIMDSSLVSEYAPLTDKNILVIDLSHRIELASDDPANTKN